jgi:hypothetical protein
MDVAVTVPTTMLLYDVTGIGGARKDMKLAKFTTSLENCCDWVSSKFV